MKNRIPLLSILLYFGLFVSCNLEKVDEDTINPCPNPPNAVFSANQNTGTAPFTVQFTNNSTGATLYQWDFGDNGTSTEISPSHVFSSAGNFTVRLIASNAAGCKDTSTLTISAAAKTTFIKVLDVGDNKSVGGSYYDFMNGQLRIVKCRFDPGKIEIYRFDSTGATSPGYPLSSNQWQMNDTSYFTIIKSNNILYFADRRQSKNSGPPISDSCSFINLASSDREILAEGGKTYPFIYRINENDLIKYTYQSLGSDAGSFKFKNITGLSFRKNGNILLWHNLLNFYYSTNLGREVFNGGSVLYTEYSPNLDFVSSNKINTYWWNLVWRFSELKSNYIMTGFYQNKCELGGQVNHIFLDKNNFVKTSEKSTSDQNLSIFEGNDPVYLKNIDANTVCELVSEGDAQVSTRIKITLGDKFTETHLPGYPIYVNAPSGYAVITPVDILKSGNNFHILATIKVNPNSISSSACLLKVSTAGQVLDVDVYDTADGLPAGVGDPKCFLKMGDGGHLICFGGPDEKITLLRVDKDGNL